MGGRGRSWKWMEEREERGQPWRRSFAWRLWEAEQAKWTAKPERVERRREKWRSWLRWLWAGKGTITTVTSLALDISLASGVGSFRGCLGIAFIAGFV
ncbi:hypothetical protein IEQ34_007657 [Dendrobium chrysotoxum]|uniref:Uncharacterized protein n=1 Tax=Dendrobium chrysotoxum TaxID=161865 RepID=A0AAV7H4F8_DENCH|nr:hypothetical protein IEQ34_007657 [Dendrobium chrysotoxum]